jgi:carboxylate-amine ligase
MVTFGIEEEYFLLDPATGLPAFVSAEVRRLLSESGDVADGDIQAELLACQVETSTPPCATPAEALRSLTAFRTELHRAAQKMKVRAASVATPPRMRTEAPEVTDKLRYHQLRESAREIVADQYVSGLHVHVNIPDKDAGVRALNRIRPWLPVIVAIGADSPFWQDRDSGFASWRTISYRRWPVQGLPPVFEDAADYEKRVQRLVDTGVIIDRGVITWVARLSENYPTLEVRAADAQLEARDSVLLAALIRALVVTALNDGIEPRPQDAAMPEVLDAALWQAGRHGLESNLLNPLSGSLEPAWEVVGALAAMVAPALAAEGDGAFVAAGLDRLRTVGTGSVRQRAAMESGGLPALIDLFTTSLTEDR